MATPTGLPFEYMARLREALATEGEMERVALAEQHDRELEDFLAELMPTSGSNLNGRWVRFPDGTQICSANIVGSFSSSLVTFTFPQAFDLTAAPLLHITATNGDFPANGFTPHVSTNTSTTVTFRRSGGSDGAARIHYIAIGRWK